jgi:hypothetical protein
MPATSDHRRGLTEVSAEDDRLVALVLARLRLQQLGCGVLRAVVDEDDLGLHVLHRREHRVDLLHEARDVLFLVETRDDQRDAHGS